MRDEHSATPITDAVGEKDKRCSLETLAVIADLERSLQQAVRLRNEAIEFLRDVIAFIDYIGVPTADKGVAKARAFLAALDRGNT